MRLFIKIWQWLNDIINFWYQLTQSNYKQLITFKAENGKW